VTSPNDSSDIHIPLSRGRVGSGARSWLLPGIAIGGLMLVPLVGLAYAATTSFGKDAPADGSAKPAAEDDDDEPGAKSTKASKGSKTKKPTSAASAKSRNKAPRSDEAAPCCEALRDLGKEAPVEQRAAYLSAASSCDAASSAAIAKKRVGNQLRTAKVDVPEACAP
jgi:hypothetical protein